MTREQDLWENDASLCYGDPGFFEGVELGVFQYLMSSKTSPDKAYPLAQDELTKAKFIKFLDQAAAAANLTGGAKHEED